MDHFLYQGMHLPVPGTVLFVVHAVFQITQYMCKAFLVAGSILIKGYIMIVDQCSPDSLQRPCPLFHRVPFCPWRNRAHRHPEPHIQIHTNFPRDIVNIGLHFFHKDVRLYAASCSEV